MKYEPSYETTQLEEYLSRFSPGEYLAYARIEIDTKIRMDARGLGFLRSALKKLKIPYAVEKGKGIELASAKNSERIISGRMSRISSAVRTAGNTHRILADKFIEEMDDETRKRVLFVGAVLGAVDAASKQYRAAFKPKANNGSLPLLPQER